MGFNGKFNGFQDDGLGLGVETFWWRISGSGWRSALVNRPRVWVVDLKIRVWGQDRESGGAPEAPPPSLEKLRSLPPPALRCMAWVFDFEIERLGCRL